MDQALMGLLGVGLFCLGLVVAVLWIFVPFAVFGIKPLLWTIIREQQLTNQLLRSKLNDQVLLRRSQ